MAIENCPSSKKEIHLHIIYSSGFFPFAMAVFGAVKDCTTVDGSELRMQPPGMIVQHLVNSVITWDKLPQLPTGARNPKQPTTWDVYRKPLK